MNNTFLKIDQQQYIYILCITISIDFDRLKGIEELDRDDNRL